METTMKIMMIDTKSNGHHESYINSLIKANEESQIVACVNSEMRLSGRTVKYTISSCDNIASYFKTIYRIKQIAEYEKPDIIHFLYGDDIYQSFGIGLRALKMRFPLIVTCHQRRSSAIRNISIRRIARNSTKLVVHTLDMKNGLNKLGIQNVVQIDYPQFSDTEKVSKNNSLYKLGVKNTNAPVLLALGGTRWDKGLDILLEALKGVNEDFHLIIAGKEEYFSREIIEKLTMTYRDKVTLILKYLDDELFSACLNASDIICLPYRKSFNGASGPLGEGVMLGKMIIGPNHGSLGQIIENNNLGFLFEAENIISLREVITNAINVDWNINESYKNYMKVLDRRVFQEKYIDLYNEVCK